MGPRKVRYDEASLAEVDVAERVQEPGFERRLSFVEGEVATSEPSAREAAEDGGARQARQASYRMKIGGMSCSFCAATIRRAYERIDGVHEVGVSLAHEEGRVKYDPEKVTPDELRRTLEQLGYAWRDPDKMRKFEEEEAELRVARNRLLVAGTFSLLSLLVMLLGVWLKRGTIPLLPWIMLTLALETMFVTAWFIKRMAFHSLRRGILNQHVLLEFGAFAGLSGGLLGLFVSDRFPAADFFAVATLVTTCHILSDYASRLVRTRSSQAVRRLMDLRPHARVLREGREEEIPIEEVAVGARVRIRPGECIPVDGRVIEGTSTVDISRVTGEPIPSQKVEGDEVTGGSVNRTGTLVVEVRRVGEESFLSEVARSIEEARSRRPRMVQLGDVVLSYYIPGVLGFAALGFLAWTLGPLLFGTGPDFFRAAFAALAVMVLGYPCALGMATPLAMIRRGGEAARQGIVMRPGEALQIMGELRSIVLDKTGTITRGEPSIRHLVTVGEHRPDDVLRMAATAESGSEHPLARAIVEAAEERDLEVVLAEGFRSHAGKGVEATVEGARVIVGKPGFLREQGITLGSVHEDVIGLEERGLTVVCVAHDAALWGAIGIGDVIKADAADAVRRMKEAGMIPMMITGDNRRSAAAVSQEVGIDRLLADVLPADKAAEVRQLQEEGQRVAMVGDGINDAPALAQADVGIAIGGTGTDIAIDSADIMLVSDRLGGVADAYEIGVHSHRKTKQNLALAFAFNGIGVPVATTGLVHPVWALVAMAASVTLVLANSFAGRLLRRAHRSEHGYDAEEAARRVAAALLAQGGGEVVGSIAADLLRHEQAPSDRAPASPRRRSAPSTRGPASRSSTTSSVTRNKS